MQIENKRIESIDGLCGVEEVAALKMLNQEIYGENHTNEREVLQQDKAI